VYDGRLSDKSDQEIEEAIRKRGGRATLLHVPPLEALKTARAQLNQPGFQGQKVMHFVSDFRDRDWTGSTDPGKLKEEVVGVGGDGINLNLIDVASPYRSSTAAAVRYNNNLAIIDFKPETRVAIEESPVEFTVQIMNYGTAEGGCDLRVFI